MTPVAFKCLVLGVKKSYGSIDPGSGFARGEWQKDSGAEDLRVLAWE